MKKNWGMFLIAAVCILVSTAVVAAPEPKMSGDVSSSECSSAFRLAKAMFNSKAPRLYAPLVIPDKVNSELVLGATALDISGGDALKTNEDYFEKVPQLGDGAMRSVYWGKQIQRGTRIVVKEIPVGWRGDMYSLYLLDANVEQNEFLKDVQHGYRESKYSALVKDTWRSPLVFLQSSSQKLWFIVVGEPYQVLADWNVYKETADGGFQRSCEITFHPKGKSTLALLPRTVQKFANLIDDTIGPGRDEGTLQPTARLRLHAQHVWANAALRPWALSESDTYNSTDEVKAGLLAWSQNGPSYRRVHREILRTYPLAESDIGNYYMRQFHLPKDKANRLAKWILDIAFRASYTFSNGQDYFRYDNVNTNPWEDIYKR